MPPTAGERRRVVLGRRRRCRGRRRGRARAARRRARRGSRPAGRRRGARRPRSRTVSKICEPMWECRPTSSRRRQGEDAPDRLGRGAAGEREAELLVLVRGRDELVGVRLDADGDPDQDPRRARPRRSPASASRSISSKRVDDDAADAGVERAAELGDATCCCRARRSARAGSRPRSATASSPPVQTSRPRPSSAIQRATVGAQERLAGVVDVHVGAERVAESRGTGARKSSSSRT